MANTPSTPPRPMVGANGSVAGASGYVPVPAAADNVKYLKGDGSWSALANASAATNAEAAAGASTTTFMTPANEAFAASHAGKSARPGIISTGASAVGTTQDNTGLAFGTGNLTIGAWVRLPDWTPGAAKVLFRKLNSSTNTGIQLSVNTTGTLLLYIGTGSTINTYVSTVATGIADGAWAFLTVTQDVAGNAVFGVNGAQLGAAVAISALSAVTRTNTQPLYWFSDGASNHADGTLGETFIVSGLLTATQIADIYRAGSIAPFSASFTFFQWCDFGQGYGPIIKDRSGQNQPALMGTSGLSHAIPRNPPGVPQRAPRVALVGDGSDGSFVRDALGSQNPSTGELVLWWDGIVPTDAMGGAKVLVALSPSTFNVVAARSAMLYYSTGDGIAFILWGATTSDDRMVKSVGLLTLIAGKRAVIAVRRSSSGLAVFVGIDGDFLNITNLFSETPTGTPPTFASSQFDGQYLVGLYRTSNASSAQSIFGLRLANVAMTEAQLRTEYERGEPGAEWSWGSKTPLYTSDFSAGVDGWSVNAATAVGNIDAIGGQDNNLRVTLSGGSSSLHQVDRTFATGLGRRYKYSVDVYIPSANAASLVIALLANGGSTTLAAAATEDAWTTISGEFAEISDKAVRVRVSGTVNADGDIFYLRNFTVTPLGYTARLRTDTAAGLTALDGSANKQDFVLSTTGVTVSPDGRRQIIRPGALTFGGAGTQQLFGASVVDTAKKWRVAHVSGTCNASVNLSLGNTGSGTQYISAQAVTAADFDIGTFASRVISGANLYATLSGAGILTNLVIVLEQTD